MFFHLYGVTDRDDIRYIYSTFPIVERKEKASYGGVYRSCELCSGPNRPLIPIESGHLFRGKPAGDSGAK